MKEAKKSFLANYYIGPMMFWRNLRAREIVLIIKINIVIIGEKLPESIWEESPKIFMVKTSFASYHERIRQTEKTMHDWRIRKVTH